MKRTIRTLLAVGAFAVIGMVALSAMLSRYNRMHEVRSIGEIEEEYAAAAEEQMLARAAHPEVGEEDGGASAGSDGVPSEEDARVEQFVYIRGRLKELIEAQEQNPARWVDTTTGTFADDLQPYAMDELRMLMVKLRLRRLELCKERGFPEGEYLEVRDAFRQWRSGEEIDVAMAEAFVARDDRIEEFDLGMLEELDG